MGAAGKERVRRERQGVLLYHFKVSSLVAAGFISPLTGDGVPHTILLMQPHHNQISTTTDCVTFLSIVTQPNHHHLTDTSYSKRTPDHHFCITFLDFSSFPLLISPHQPHVANLLTRSPLSSHRSSITSQRSHSLPHFIVRQPQLVAHSHLTSNRFGHRFPCTTKQSSPPLNHPLPASASVHCLDSKPLSEPS